MYGHACSLSAFCWQACDGLWTVLDENSAVKFIRERLWAMKQYQKAYSEAPRSDCIYPERKFDLDGICKQLIQYAVHEKGCKDNVTAMIVHFDHA